MDGGEGWWDLDLGGPECDGGALRCGSGRSPKKN